MKKRANKSLQSEHQKKYKVYWKSLLEFIFIILLAIYPFRHINWGLDLMDTGYNYANFQNIGTEHMDSMWLFSTYLANVVGHFLTFLPNGDTLLGLNLYTRLLLFFLVLVSFIFSTKVLKFPSWIAFLGEFISLSLCWCPTAVLYNYISYILLFICVILLYLGLTQEKNVYLFFAGVCLGINVFVRFSNLPEATLILAVWAYDILGKGIQKENAIGYWALLKRHTLWCLMGYLLALVILLLQIHTVYGIENYIEGIHQLFAMTDNATDYKATSMIRGIIHIYVDNFYWVIRIAIILLIGILTFILVGWLQNRLSRVSSIATKTTVKLLSVCERILMVLLALSMLGWLYIREFCSFKFYSYDSILRPGILFLMLTILISLIRIFHPTCTRNEKLLSWLVLIIVLVTPLGSNNGIFPGLNNLFLAAPYTLWQSWCFLQNVEEIQFRKIRLYSFPAKVLLTVYLALCLFQFGIFGAVFVFAEGSGVQNPNSYVQNNVVLQGIKMCEDKAQWITEINNYIEEQELQSQELISYGNIPSLSFYLQMPAAFNPWSDLASYSFESMGQNLKETTVAMKSNIAKRPVIIVEKEYITYLYGGINSLSELGLGEQRILEIEQDQKWLLLLEFMKENDYKLAFGNEKFSLFY